MKAIYHAKEKTRVNIYKLTGGLQPVTLAFHELENGKRWHETFFPDSGQFAVKYTYDDYYDPVVLKGDEAGCVEFTDTFTVSVWENQNGVC
jgi:hypothetical protein